MERKVMMDITDFVIFDEKDTRKPSLFIEVEKLQKIYIIQTSVKRPYIKIESDDFEVELMDTPETWEFLKKYFNFVKPIGEKS